MPRRRSLRNLIEDLRVMMLDPPWSDYACLLRCVNSMMNAPEMERLTNDELRAVKGFHYTLQQCASMEPAAMVAHIYAHWVGANGVVAQAIRKLPIGREAFGAFERLTMGPYIGDVSDSEVLT